MNKKKEQTIYQVMFKKFIIDKLDLGIGDNLSIVGFQNCNRKDLVFVMIEKHHCGRPKKKEGGE